MYQCPCGAAPREITPRQLLTSAPRESELPKRPSPPWTSLDRVPKENLFTGHVGYITGAGSLPKASAPPESRKYTNRSPMNKAWLADKIGEVVDAKLAKAKVGLTRQEVVDVVREELRSALGESEPAPCPRRPHRGRCGKMCAEARKVAA